MNNKSVALNALFAPRKREEIKLSYILNTTQTQLSVSKLFNVVNDS